MFWFNGKSLQGTSINYKTIKIINPNGSNSQWVLQHPTKQLLIWKVVPWALQVSWLELGQGTGMGSFPWVAPSENPRRAGVCGTVGSSAQGSGGPRAEAGHRLLASLFSFLRKNIKFIHVFRYWPSNYYVARTVLGTEETKSLCSWSLCSSVERDIS